MSDNSDAIIHRSDATAFRNQVEYLIRKYDHEFVPSLSDRDESLQKVIENFTEGKEILIAKKDGEIVGIVLFSRGAERKPISAQCPCLYINLIIIEEDYRREGIGTQLYTKLNSEILEKSKFDTLAGRTWKDNKGSRKLFKQTGFNIEAEDEEEERTTLYYIYSTK